MFRSVYIQRFFSSLLLLVFVLSITPKRFLHTVFAKHVDSRQAKSSPASSQLSNAGYNCDTDNVVAESPFSTVANIFMFPACTGFSVYATIDISFSSVQTAYTSLRGPPVNI